MLVDGWNSLDDLDESIVITLTKMLANEEKVKVNMENFQKKSCSNKTIVIVISCVCVFLLLVICIGLVVFVKRRQKDQEETERVDANPDYGSDYYGLGGTEVKDRNDYYFYSKPEDTASLTDMNEYYS